jgi:hypothetical protein
VVAIEGVVPASSATVNWQSQDMAWRKKRREMELLWRGAASFGTDADIFTGNFASGRSCAQATTQVWLSGLTLTVMSNASS